jgi:outer membrane protein
MKKLLLALMLVLPLSASAQKFGHVNIADIVQSLPEFATAQQEFESKGKMYQEELNRMRDEFQAKLEDYQKNAETLPDAVKERRESELSDLQQRIQEYANKVQTELGQYQDQKLQEMQQKVMKAVEEVGIAGGYVYIFDVTSLPYASKSSATDVTPDVKKKLGL